MRHGSRINNQSSQWVWAFLSTYTVIGVRLNIYLKEVNLNYFAVQKKSNTILRVIHSPAMPSNTDGVEFCPAGKSQLTRYLELVKHDEPINIYSVLPRPVIPEILQLKPEEEVALVDYVLKNCRYYTVERMAFDWRVTQQVVTDILAKVGNS